MKNLLGLDENLYFMKNLSVGEELYKIYKLDIGKMEWVKFEGTIDGHGFFLRYSKYGGVVKLDSWADTMSQHGRVTRHGRVFNAKQREKRNKVEAKHRSILRNVPKRKRKRMEDFEKKVRISEGMDVDQNGSNHHQIVSLLRQFLGVQQQRAEAYAKLKKGFTELGDSAYQQLCSEITLQFNECSKQVLALESIFLSPSYSRNDLASILRSVQVQEKQKLHLTATIQVLKKAGRPSERLVSHENCKFKNPSQHECVHVHEITEAAGTEEAEADAEYDNAMKEAIQGVQDAVMAINEHLEEVRYEIAALESD